MGLIFATAKSTGQGTDGDRGARLEMLNYVLGPFYPFVGRPPKVALTNPHDGDILGGNNRIEFVVIGGDKFSGTDLGFGRRYRIR